MNTNSLSFQLGTSVAQYLMQYGQKELNYEEFKAGIEYVMNMSAKAKEEGEKFLAENANVMASRQLPAVCSTKYWKLLWDRSPKRLTASRCTTRVHSLTVLSSTAVTSAENPFLSRSMVLSRVGPKVCN